VAPAAEGLGKLPRAMRWGLLIGASALLAAGLSAVHLPAALLLGPMIAGILVGINGGAIRAPRIAYLCAQAIIGCMIARTFTPSILTSVARGWALFLPVVLTTMAAASLLGWLMSRWRLLPGTTAIWGSSPGAAATMVLMAEAYGADFRLVAFMQYLRVVLVALSATLIARFGLGAAGGTPPTVDWFAPVHWPALAGILAIAAIGIVFGDRLKIPAGVMLVPMVLATVLQFSGTFAIELPEWLLAPTYAMLGWTIGLGFTRQVLAHAARALPQIIMSNLVLISFCAGLAFLLTRFLGIDPLTAYLATSPGGMDSVAIIAASSRVDVSFVMALQAVRFCLVVLLGPRVARVVAERARVVAVNPGAEPLKGPER